METKHHLNSEHVRYSLNHAARVQFPLSLRSSIELWVLNIQHSGFPSLVKIEITFINF